jgi:cbb3-type cytochrome oxidase maturation protein
MIWLIVSSIALGLSGMLIYIYYLRKGQFEDPEDVKYQMFRDEEK